MTIIAYIFAALAGLGFAALFLAGIAAAVILVRDEIRRRRK